MKKPSLTKIRNDLYREHFEIITLQDEIQKLLDEVRKKRKRLDSLKRKYNE